MRLSGAHGRWATSRAAGGGSRLPLLARSAANSSADIARLCQEAVPRRRAADEEQAAAPAEEPRRGFGAPADLTTDVRLPALPQTPDLGGRAVRARWNPVHLAYLGDAVWELFVRNHHFSPPTKLKQYYEEVQTRVCAEGQAIFYELLASGPLLSAEEQDVMRWGHNAKVAAPKRFSASGKHVDTYKRATALECLIGYLYLTDTARLHDVVTYLLAVPV